MDRGGHVPELGRQGPRLSARLVLCRQNPVKIGCDDQKTNRRTTDIISRGHWQPSGSTVSPRTIWPRGMIPMLNSRFNNCFLFDFQINPSGQQTTIVRIGEPKSESELCPATKFCENCLDNIVQNYSNWDPWSVKKTEVREFFQK